MRLEFDGEFPRCFNSREEFKAWVQAARGSSPRAGFCTDCTKEYQARMVKESRCQYPEVEFYDFEMDKDGYFPNRYFHLKRLQGENGPDEEQCPESSEADGYGQQALRWAQEGDEEREDSRF